MKKVLRLSSVSVVTMSGKDGERFDGLLLSMAHDCSDGGVQEMIDLIFRYQGYTYCRVVTTLVFTIMPN